ncbi:MULTISPECIES: hypothetical protein [Aphanizomenonaceae]|nr:MULTISPECIES: hypothetical protein [Aphanizomenonaceae]MDK2461373.1 hypothetical protein [Aphanizomenon sp. PH219]
MLAAALVLSGTLRERYRTLNTPKTKTAIASIPTSQTAIAYL